MSDEEKETAAEFDQFAATYDEDLQRALSISGEDKNFFCEGRILWLAGWLAEQSYKPHTVLDYGCGTGSATPYIFRHLGATRLVGSDVSQESLKKARLAYDTEAVSFREVGNTAGENFDLAFCNGVFHHIVPEMRGVALQEIRDSLKPGGLFAMFENNPWNPGTRYAMRRCAFDRDAMPLSPPEAKRWMQEAGFRVLTTRYVFFFPRILAALRFLEPVLSPLPMGAQYVVVGMKI